MNLALLPLTQRFHASWIIFTLTLKKFSSVPKLVAYEGNRASPVIQNLMGIAALLTYQKKRAEGKDHLNAIGRVCHKILAIIFAVLSDNKPYVPPLDFL